MSEQADKVHRVEAFQITGAWHVCIDCGANGPTPPMLPCPQPTEVSLADLERAIRQAKYARRDAGPKTIAAEVYPLLSRHAAWALAMRETYVPTTAGEGERGEG
jgi:hypothetical protein